jgi:hypothetical protein
VGVGAVREPALAADPVRGRAMLVALATLSVVAGVVGLVTQAGEETVQMDATMLMPTAPLASPGLPETAPRIAVTPEIEALFAEVLARQAAAVPVPADPAHAPAPSGEADPDTATAAADGRGTTSRAAGSEDRASTEPRPDDADGRRPLARLLRGDAAATRAAAPTRGMPSVRAVVSTTDALAMVETPDGWRAVDGRPTSDAHAEIVVGGTRHRGAHPARTAQGEESPRASAGEAAFVARSSPFTFVEVPPELLGPARDAAPARPVPPELLGPARDAAPAPPAPPTAEGDSPDAAEHGTPMTTWGRLLLEQQVRDIGAAARNAAPVPGAAPPDAPVDDRAVAVVPPESAAEAARPDAVPLVREAVPPAPLVEDDVAPVAEPRAPVARPASGAEPAADDGREQPDARPEAAPAPARVPATLTWPLRVAAAVARAGTPILAALDRARGQQPEVAESMGLAPAPRAAAMPVRDADDPPRPGADDPAAENVRVREVPPPEGTSTPDTGHAHPATNRDVPTLAEPRRDRGRPAPERVPSAQVVRRDDDVPQAPPIIPPGPPPAMDGGPVRRPVETPTPRNPGVLAMAPPRDDDRPFAAPADAAVVAAPLAPEVPVAPSVPSARPVQASVHAAAEGRPVVDHVALLERALRMMSGSADPGVEPTPRRATPAAAASVAVSSPASAARAPQAEPTPPVTRAHAPDVAPPPETEPAPERAPARVESAGRDAGEAPRGHVAAPPPAAPDLAAERVAAPRPAASSPSEVLERVQDQVERMGARMQGAEQERVRFAVTTSSGDEVHVSLRVARSRVEVVLEAGATGLGERLEAARTDLADRLLDRGYRLSSYDVLEDGRESSWRGRREQRSGRDAREDEMGEPSS